MECATTSSASVHEQDHDAHLVMAASAIEASRHYIAALQAMPSAAGFDLLRKTLCKVMDEVDAASAILLLPTQPLAPLTAAAAVSEKQKQVEKPVYSPSIHMAGAEEEEEGPRYNPGSPYYSPKIPYLPPPPPPVFIPSAAFAPLPPVEQRQQATTMAMDPIEDEPEDSTTITASPPIDEKVTVVNGDKKMKKRTSPSRSFAIKHVHKTPRVVSSSPLHLSKSDGVLHTREYRAESPKASECLGTACCGTEYNTIHLVTLQPGDRLDAPFRLPTNIDKDGFQLDAKMPECSSSTSFMDLSSKD